jgi:hypothetical protein
MRESSREEALRGGSDDGPASADSELSRVRLLVKSDQPGLADSDGRSTKVSGRPQNERGEIGRAGRVLLHLEDDHLLALGDDDAVRAGEERLEVGLAVALLRSVDRLTDGSAPTPEEGVGTPTARSALAVVIPVDARGHVRRRA